MDIVGNSMSQLTDRVLLTSRAAARLVGHYTARHLIPRHSPTSTAIPVAGFDKEAVQELYFTLQQCAVNTGGDQAIALPLHWLQSLQLCQVASGRLIADLEDIERNIVFWEGQLNGGELNMLLSNGPIACFRHVSLALHLRNAGPDDVSATYRLQRRTRLLKAARALLAEALANVCKAAATLRVQHRSKDSMSPPVIANLQTPRRKDDDALLETARLACHSCLPTLSTTLVSLQLAVKESRYSSYKAVLQQAALERSASVIEYEQERFKNLGSALATLDSFIHMPTNFLDDDIPDTEGVTGRDLERLNALSEGTLKRCVDAKLIPDATGDEEGKSLVVCMSHVEQLLGVHLTPYGNVLDDKFAQSSLSWWRPSHLLQRLVSPPMGDPVGGSVVHTPSVGGPGGGWPMAGYALQAAKEAATGKGALASLPRWALMPSHLTRYWAHYSVLGVGMTWMLNFVFRHSSLAGSDDLEKWVIQAYEVLRGNWQEHAVQPIKAISDELFKTFRDRPSIVCPEEFINDKKALLRMVTEFQQDTGVPMALGSTSNTGKTSSTSSTHSAEPVSGATAPGPPSSTGPQASQSLQVTMGLSREEEEQLNQGMRLVMESYENELKSPMKGLMYGMLARSMLIQVQRLYVDTEATMLELDQILRANELSISIVAAVPALAVGWLLLMAIMRRVLPLAPNVKHEATPLRMATARLVRYLHRADQEARGGLDPSNESQGLTEYHISRVYKEAVMLYKYHDRTSQFSEWPQLKADILEVARIGSKEPMSRLAVVERLMRTYSVFER